MLDLAIVIVAYHSHDDLPHLLRSIEAAASPASWHAVIVNNSPDETLVSLQHLDSRVTVIESGCNLGYSGGINVGVASAPPAQVVVFLNPDLILMPQSLNHLLTALANAEAAVPKVVDAAGTRQNSLRREPTILGALGDAVFGDHWAGRPTRLSETVRDPHLYDSVCSIDWATGAALAVKGDTVNQVGKWDEARFFMYSEETDYARRIRQSGGRILFVPAAVVSHRAGGSGSSPQLDALLEVNKLRYFRKWHGVFASAVFALVLVTRNVIRPHRAGSRAALRALVSMRARVRLPGGSR